MRRYTGIVLIALALGAATAAPASAQSGCGGLLQPACPAPTPTPAPTPVPTPAPTPTPAPEPVDPLSPERFAALQSVLVASAALEKGKLTNAKIRKYRTACTALSTQDPLLRAFRKICLVDVEGYEYNGLATCRSSPSCNRASTKIAKLAARTASAARALNPIATREIADKKCRAAVRSQASSIRKLDQFASGFRQLATAYRKDSRKLFNRAIARLNRIDKLPGRSNARQLKDLRADCR